ncbi:MAG: acetolactate synthase large subunit [Candidatus Acidiferrum sp.]
MNGAESLVQSLVNGGVEVCFTNPGTSEMHIVAALDRVAEMRCVLGLFEGVVTAAADGYARMAGKPACTLLHLGPGFANGIANLHNARRANVPLVNIVGQHATYHLRHNTPLTSDIEGLARTCSSWVRTSSAAPEICHDVAEALAAARTAPGRISTLIVPADVAWSQGGTVLGPPKFRRPPVPASEIIERAAIMLRSKSRTALLLAGSALHGRGLAVAGRIAAATGAQLLAPYPFARMQRGAGVPPVERMAYILEQAAEQLKVFRQLILVGASAPVAYFAAPGKNCVLTPPECEVHTCANPEEDCVGTLEALEVALSLTRAQGAAAAPARVDRPTIPAGEISLTALATAVAALLPENAIVVDESMTSGRDLMPATKSCPPHEWLANTGGSIGIALPLAVGAAVACPERRVLCLSADGSGMYTAQALWTMAREGLKVTTVIFANRVYGVLKREFSYLGVGDPGPRVRDLFEIGRPDIDWVYLARSMGVPGVRASSMDSFVNSLRDALASDGPALIEVRL